MTRGLPVPLLLPALAVSLGACTPRIVSGPASVTEMTPSPTIRAQVLATLDTFNACVRARDVEGALALFVPEAEALLVGSSAGEVARGPEAIRALFARVFRAPYTVGWEWDETHVAASGDVAWLFAEGWLVLRRPEGETRQPYRLSAVFVRRAEGWRWAQFHGAEPAPE